VWLLDGVRRPGAKILISGGTRCNVTNRLVTEGDFWGGPRPIVRRVLRQFTSDQTVQFFRDLGVVLHEEADGKMFPDTGRARDVLDALTLGMKAAGVVLLADHRVLDIERVEGGFHLHTAHGPLRSRRLVLATGGQSLPKTGSDGLGYEFARRLGHTIVPTTPALVPLILDAGERSSIHCGLSGVSHEAELTVWVDDRAGVRLEGSILWTHFGISGPVALNASRHWLRARLEGRPVRLTANFCPGETFDTIERRWTEALTARPKVSITTLLAEFVPASVAAAMIERLELDPSHHLAHLTREDRRAIVRALVEWPLPVTGSRGYNYAEVTAGGVALDEIDPTTMQSRVCPGLFLVGEILDVDGRIGGFNFQWAWSTGYVAGRALALP
jgi:predicted Rossmann fold flavoprotein